MSELRQAVVESASVADTLAIGRAFGGSLGGIPGRVIVSLEGDLGAGKTLLARGIGEGLGVEDAVTSPTYVIRHDYETFDGRAVYHVDAFRLEGSLELEPLVLEDAGRDGAIVLLEWGDRVLAALPRAETIRVKIASTGETTRTIRFEYPEGVPGDAARESALS
jgi:tRNA threonylcarbamoyladenosine biosynthesis protein TsaE